MRFATPMYDGDSIIRPGPEAQPSALETTLEVNSTPEMVHRKIAPSEPKREPLAAAPYAAEPFVIDTFEIERRARALRAAAMRSALVSLWSWIERSFETVRRRRVEEYLSRAQSVAELEARLRKLERGDDLVRI
jgi:flagellar biosynthesis regulator FlaF